MNTDTLQRDALDAGLDVRLADGVVLISGDNAVVSAWAPRLRPHKAEIIQRLTESSRITHELLQAAMRTSDHHSDSDSDTGRQQMRADVLAIPLDQRADLLQHFDRAYPAQQDRDHAGGSPADSQGTPAGNGGRVNSTSRSS